MLHTTFRTTSHEVASKRYELCSLHYAIPGNQPPAAPYPLDWKSGRAAHESDWVEPIEEAAGLCPVTVTHLNSGCWRRVDPERASAFVVWVMQKKVIPTRWIWYDETDEGRPLEPPPGFKRKSKILNKLYSAWTQLPDRERAFLEAKYAEKLIFEEEFHFLFAPLLLKMASWFEEPDPNLARLCIHVITMQAIFTGMKDRDTGFHPWTSECHDPTHRVVDLTTVEIRQAFIMLRDIVNGQPDRAAEVAMWADAHVDYFRQRKFELFKRLRPELPGYNIRRQNAVTSGFKVDEYSSTTTIPLPGSRNADASINTAATPIVVAENQRLQARRPRLICPQEVITSLADTIATGDDVVRRVRRRTSQTGTPPSTPSA